MTPQQRAVEFAYQRLGQHLAPESPLGWSKVYGERIKKAKDASQEDARTYCRLGPGAGVLTTENECLFVGMRPDVPAGRPAPYRFDPNLTAAALKLRCLFNPPEGRWMGLAWGKKSVLEGNLVLNTDRNSATFLDDSGYQRITVRPIILSEMAQAVAEQGVKQTDIARAARLFESANASVVLENKDQEKYRELVIGKPLGAVLRNLRKYEIPVGILLKYLDYREELGHAE
ncbi:MAG: hypothetical protein K8I30_16460 [Anaerolineae bacterium]|nr:hypothetical protein [Anaerolineae bacterium]